MKTIQKTALTLTLLLLVSTQHMFAHCEVPCGIYDDQLRIELIKEHITTIEKSMNQINELSKAGQQNYNQLVRWVTNKEEHASQLQEIVSQYFLHQRIKITDAGDKEAFEKYTKQLMLLHQMAVYSMKCKQGTDLENVTKLREATLAFEESYFHKHE